MSEKYTEIDAVNWTERTISLVEGGSVRIPGITVRALLKALEGADPDAMVTYMSDDLLSVLEVGASALYELFFYSLSFS